MYFVTHTLRGPFGGEYADFYGGYFMRINYPGPADAARGLARKQISRVVHDQIVSAWRARAETSRGTTLGSGIGFHGWAGPWRGEVDGHALSWGCIVLHEGDI